MDEDTLIDRIAIRKNTFGKQAHELKNILEWRKDVTDRDRDAGAIIVDSSLPLGEVVDEILDKAKSM